MKESTLWYVIYTRPRWEKKIAQLLEEKGIVHYCPLNRIEKQWSDRKKVVFEPLFKGYIFIKIEETQKWDIKMINGIINYVYWLGKPAKVKDEEIDKIKMFLQEFDDVEVIDNKIDVNSTVIINQGVLMSYKGIVVDVLGNKARVQIDSMGIRISAIFKKANLTQL
jgi:transcription antitermination factor NusG